MPRCPEQPPDDGGMQVVDAGPMTLLPPAPGKCQECAAEHAPGEPHNQQSLYYQIRFEQQHGRAPTWSDAMAHCAPETRRLWREELVKMLGRNAVVLPEEVP